MPSYGLPESEPERHILALDATRGIFGKIMVGQYPAVYIIAVAVILHPGIERRAAGVDDAVSGRCSEIEGREITQRGISAPRRCSDAVGHSRRLKKPEEGGDARRDGALAIGESRFSTAGRATEGVKVIGDTSRRVATTSRSTVISFDTCAAAGERTHCAQERYYDCCLVCHVPNLKQVCYLRRSSIISMMSVSEPG